MFGSITTRDVFSESRSYNDLGSRNNNFAHNYCSRKKESYVRQLVVKADSCLVPQVRAPVLGANLGGACPDVTALPRARALDLLG